MCSWCYLQYRHRSYWCMYRTYEDSHTMVRSQSRIGHSHCNTREHRSILRMQTNLGDVDETERHRK